MAKVLKCGDLNPGCTFEARGNSEDEVLKQAAEHARTRHNMKEISPEFQNKAPEPFTTKAPADKKPARKHCFHNTSRGSFQKRRLLRAASLHLRAGTLRSIGGHPESGCHHFFPQVRVSPAVFAITTF